MPASTDRIRQDVTDISSASQLLGYATAGQIAQLQRQRRDMSQAKIAQGAGFAAHRRNSAAVLSTALRAGPTRVQLHKLDEAIGALSPGLENTGGLSSLALRLSAEQGDKGTGSLTAQIPPSWTGRILRNVPTDEVGVLIQASALLRAFGAADRADTDGRGVAVIRERYAREMDLLVRRLILVSVAPPTSISYDAQAMLARLASYAFRPMRERLDSELRYSPLGFRVWRAITQLVRLGMPGGTSEELRAWVRRLLIDSEDLRDRSLYAGESFDLELAISVPPAWSPPHDDWAGGVLRARAWNREATIRERGTAAMGLWQRAIGENPPNLENIRDELRELITEFMDPAARPDAPAGLRWVAATLEHVIGHPLVDHVLECCGHPSEPCWCVRPGGGIHELGDQLA